MNIEMKELLYRNSSFIFSRVKFSIHCYDTQYNNDYANILLKHIILSENTLKYYIW